MKVKFSNGQAQVMEYYNPEVDGKVYLDDSLRRKLKELKWVDEEMVDLKILEQLEFKIDLELKAWQIATPIPFIASCCSEIDGVIHVEKTDYGTIYICKYPWNYTQNG